MLDLKTVKPPKKPGVYKMLDAKKNILYIGKAKDIKKRLTQHFLGGKKNSPKNQVMLEQVTSLEWVTTDTETEALILESLLIKDHKPKYNILLRDDKNFLYVKITNEEYPKILLVRKIIDHKSTYFGPYTNSGFVRHSLDFAEKIFPYKCLTFFKKGVTGKPCFNYHIHRCPGLCTGECDPDQYRQILRHISSFLKGNIEEIEQLLTEKMKKEASEQKFELAAKTRDMVQSLHTLREKQKVIDPNNSLDQDIFGIIHEKTAYFVNILKIRSGRLLAQEQYHLTALMPYDESGEALEHILSSYYSITTNFPKEILVDCEPANKSELEQWLAGLRGSKVTIMVPQKGKKSHLIEMALKNAETLVKKQEIQRESNFDPKKALIELHSYLSPTNYRISSTLHRIECYDISHISGTHTVSSMVVFIDGIPDKKMYRHFKIASVQGIDDFRSMEETIGRRLRHIIQPTPQEIEKGESLIQKPDLIILDGGKGQLSFGYGMLKKMKLENSIPMVSLAKEHEDIFTPFSSDSLPIPKDSQAQYLIEQLRDESHRFANSFNKRLRLKSDIVSHADTIRGIGPKKKKLLMQTYGSIREAKKAPIAELAKILGQKVAEAFVGS